jgi:23S rRNA pseudouridine2605 synthase
MINLRLAKFLAYAGVGSRRQAEKFITNGRVTVNGTTILEKGYKIAPDRDLIKFDGLMVSKQDSIYLLLNKPQGYISSVYDPQGRPTVIDLVKDISVRIYPVGRLDLDTSGLLILTNDGEFTNLMIHPRYEISKKYEAWVKGNLTPRSLITLKEGVLLDDGKTAPAKVCILKEEKDKTLLEIDIHEGRKRQVKRMCIAVGHPVLSLKRTAFSFLTLKGVANGKFRYLTPQEVTKLKDAAKQTIKSIGG